MIITKNGVDIISISEKNEDIIYKNNPDKKVHLIRLDFEDPSKSVLDDIIENFPLTNRFVVNEDVKFYNWFFKNNNKKYYVENSEFSGIFSFFKKNNKILLNFNKLRQQHRNFLLQDDIFRDILKNLEIIELTQEVFNEKKGLLIEWSGNVII